MKHHPPVQGLHVRAVGRGKADTVAVRLRSDLSHVFMHCDGPHWSAWPLLPRRPRKRGAAQLGPDISVQEEAGPEDETKGRWKQLPDPHRSLPRCCSSWQRRPASPGVSNTGRLCSLLGAPADGRLVMAAGPGFLSMKPARRCPHRFPLLLHIGLSKLTGINDDKAP